MSCISISGDERRWGPASRDWQCWGAGAGRGEKHGAPVRAGSPDGGGLPWLLLSNSRRPLSPIAAGACSPAVFTCTWYSASRLPEVRGRACAQAAGASYASYRSGSMHKSPAQA
jgi:hypothetical protein